MKVEFRYAIIALILGFAITGIVSAEIVAGDINYQGRLTDENGNPCDDGYYSVRFSLYQVESGGTAVATSSKTVYCDNGYFSANIPFSPTNYWGERLWLGITILPDEEMTPRQEIRPVPYALSLRPGALISNTLSALALKIESSASNGDGVSIKTTGESSDGLSVETTQSSSPGIVVVTQQTNSDGIQSATYGANSPAVYAYSEDFYGIYAVGGFYPGIYATTYNTDDNAYGIYTPDYLYAKGARVPTTDVAEYMPVTEDVEPGTVMIIGDDGKLQVSNTAYDTRVAGIVSTAPGVSLGTKENGNPGEEQIAIGGRVPCKVDATKAPIHAGDLLTTSDMPGYAMKAEPIEAGGKTFYPSGIVLGKAMGPLESGTGIIEVLVTLQ